MSAPSRRLAAILAADIAGYSALMAADEEATVRDLKAHQAVILPMIGAVVTDRGGALCHCAIVAREFGIPAVVGADQATSRIPDGARILVDGDRGFVAVRP